MKRHHFSNHGLSLSYLDSGGDAPVLIALHARWMEGAEFAPLADALAPDWRMIALDQRGHGHSDHAPSYQRADYLSDLDALYDAAGIDRAVLLGNSLGGVNAFQFAATRPDRVAAMIVEDIGCVIGDDTSFALAWGGSYPTRTALEAKVGERCAPYLANSIRHDASGWHLAFDPRDSWESQKQLNGDHWGDWLASTCPALLIRGADSRVSDPELLAEMAARRPNTRLVTLPGGHMVHVDSPDAFAAQIGTFLGETIEPRANP